jgi:hypothetical protein
VGWWSYKVDNGDNNYS